MCKAGLRVAKQGIDGRHIVDPPKSDRMWVYYILCTAGIREGMMDLPSGLTNTQWVALVQLYTLLICMTSSSRAYTSLQHLLFC